MAKKTLTPEDRALFRNSIGDVRTVHTDKVLLSAANKPKPYPKPTLSDARQPLNTALSNDGLEPVGLEDSLSYTAPGLQHSVLKKLRRGYFGIDAELDLHGLISTAAQQQLLHFLQHSVNAGYRCVHIVHGKGYRSTGQQPVLKNHINLWLRQHQDVQAFCSASPKDGGAGAVLVLLKA